MYTPHPIPTFNPVNSNTAYNNWFSWILEVWERIVNMLQSVPVIPNRDGLFDPETKEWLTPTVSLMDIIIASIIIGVAIVLIFRLSGIAGVGIGTQTIRGGLRMGSYDRPVENNHYHLNQTYKEYKILHLHKGWKNG